MTSVTYCKIPTNASCEELFHRVQKLLPHADNKAHLDGIMSRKNTESKKESLTALLLLGALLKEFGIDTSALGLKRNENGKPYFDNAPSLHFSLTHSGGYAAAALSDTCPVGLDLEVARISPDKAETLAKRFFSDSETAEIIQSQTKFSKIWTKKEAYSKMRGITLAEHVYEEKSAKYNQNSAFFVFWDIGDAPLTLCTERELKNVSFHESVI